MEQEDKIPQHIVLLPDGNRRWAKERGLDTLEGHKAGYEKLTQLCHWAKDRGVKVVTAFGFSTENWNRSEREVNYLMGLLEFALRENFSSKATKNEIKELGLRVRIIGQKERLPQSLQETIAEVEEHTKANTNLHLNLAISYGGRWDIVQAAKQIMQDGIKPEDLTEELFGKYLSTGDLPDPDLFIRAGSSACRTLCCGRRHILNSIFCPSTGPTFQSRTSTTLLPSLPVALAVLAISFAST